MKNSIGENVQEVVGLAILVAPGLAILVVLLYVLQHFLVKYW